MRGGRQLNLGFVASGFMAAILFTENGYEFITNQSGLETVYGYEQTSSHPKLTSAFPPKADILVAVTDFRV
jgi:hypothetical protein